MSESYTIESLLEIMHKLRDPDSGCPWDLEQNFKSITPYTIEEAYEVADAIERNDYSELKDELGDLLLQVVFHSQMAKELNEFEFKDVVASICDKMVKRHPHVFSDANISSAEEQTIMWDKLKAQERKEKNSNTSILTDVASNLPGLTRARKLTRRAAQVGFDWSDIDSVFAKFDEEYQELREAIVEEDPDHVEEEFGDLLFVLANLSRHLKLDPEKALRRSNQKFISRFQSVEKAVSSLGKSIEKCSLDELNTLWDTVKENERKLWPS